jgi:hypothetical protein
MADKKPTPVVPPVPDHADPLVSLGNAVNDIREEVAKVKATHSDSPLMAVAEKLEAVSAAFLAAAKPPETTVAAAPETPERCECVVCRTIRGIVANPKPWKRD